MQPLTSICSSFGNFVSSLFDMFDIVCLLHQLTSNASQTHLKRKSNAPQAYLKRISNISRTSAHRQHAHQRKPSHQHQLGSKHKNPTTHLKNSKAFRKRRLSSLRPFPIPLSTQIFLQGRLPQCRVRALGVRRCNA